LNTPALLAASGLSFSRNDEPVFGPLDFHVDAGEALLVQGGNGAGKTTLLRVLAGLQQPQGGHVMLHGQPLQGPHPRLAVAFQDPSLLPWLSLEKNVAFGLDFARQPALAADERRARVDHAIAAVGLEHARNQYPAQLSGGMAQRTALARCLARQPEVLLLDEPFGALDEVTRADMQQLLLQLIATHNTAAVLITHDIDEALLLSDRVLLLGDHPAHPRGQWRVALLHPRTQQVEALGALRIEILKTLRRASRTNEPQPTPLPSEAVHVHG